MKIGYARVSKHDDSQLLDSQIDALKESGVLESNIYTDKASGKKDDRVGLESCLKSLRDGDTLLVWKLDRLGRDLRHLLNIVHDIEERSIKLLVLSGAGQMDTSTSGGKLMFSMFAAFAEYERELIRERTLAGLKSARARGRIGGRKSSFTPKKLKIAQAAMQDNNTVVSDLCFELGVSTSTLYRHVTANGKLTEQGEKILMKKKNYNE